MSSHFWSITRTYLTIRLWFSVFSYSGGGSPPRQSSVRLNKNKHAKFLSRSGNMTSRGNLRRNPKRSQAWPNSPVKDLLPGNPSDYNTTNFLRFLVDSGVATPPSRRGRTNPQEYYSTFHKTPHGKKFFEEEWRDFTEESTWQAVAEWASSPEFTDWIIKNAGGIQLHPDDSSDESVGSGSDSTYEYVAQSSSARVSLRPHHW